MTLISVYRVYSLLALTTAILRSISDQKTLINFTKWKWLCASLQKPTGVQCPRHEQWQDIIPECISTRLWMRDLFSPSITCMCQSHLGMSISLHLANWETHKHILSHMKSRWYWTLLGNESLEEGAGRRPLLLSVHGCNKAQVHLWHLYNNYKHLVLTHWHIKHLHCLWLKN